MLFQFRSDVRRISSKKATSLMYQVIIHLILIALIFAMFFLSSVNKVNSKVVKQQVLEKQIALMIDSVPSGTSLSILKSNKWGIISELKIENGRIFVSVDGAVLSRGYPFFTKYSVFADSDEQRYYIRIK